ncbi:MAG: anthranilate phosphoribosyltransferase [Nitrospirae bacterium]|nr:anthranilate phosphoribosyltransferase [Nitrospirota bacterium]
MIKDAINAIVHGNNLNIGEMTECMTEIMSGNASDAQIGAFITALRIKGETVDEIVAAARIMRQKATTIKAPDGAIDTCGTGGDNSHTFNISTTSAIVIAACGIPVAKHGNRSVSSKSGSADLLEALGVKIDLRPEKVEKCLFETGFGFLFAPLFHPAMRFAIGPRREIAIRTIFNILGPISNPAGAKRQLVGVYSEKLTEPLALVLGTLGAEDVMVVHGMDGIDEITITAGTKVSRFIHGRVENSFMAPEDFGMKKGSPTRILGGDAKANAEFTLSVLNGEKGVMRDIVVINSAVGVMLGGKTNDKKTAVKIVQEAIDSGAAINKLKEIIKISNAL